jgi:hypothetical protein
MRQSLAQWNNFYQIQAKALMKPVRKKGIAIAFIVTIMLVADTSARFKDDNGVTRKNLRVIPRTISEEELIKVMREINVALGVKCSYCHQEIPGKTTPEGHPAHDFASDNKLQKRIARKMMLMTRNINDKLEDIGDHEFERVSCITCHRGHTQPSFTLDSARLKDIRH